MVRGEDDFFGMCEEICDKALAVGVGLGAYCASAKV